MATTFADIATDALLDLGVVAAGETPTSDDLNNALRAMNRQLDQYAAERLQIYTVTASTCTIVSGTQTYTLGAGGDVNVVRPTYLERVTYTFTPPGGTYPVEFPLIPMTDRDWEAQPLKTMQSTLPLNYYYNPTFPLGTLKLWPIPTSPPATLTLTVYAPQQVGEFTALSTVIALPPGYRRMLVKNLAVEMAPSYQRNVAPELQRAADDSKGAVKASNVRMSDMSFDPACLGMGTPNSMFMMLPPG